MALNRSRRSKLPTPRRPAPHTRLVALVRDVPCGIYTATREGRVIRANPALTRLLGLTAGERLPATMAEFYQDPADQDLVWAMATGIGPAEPREMAWCTRDGRPLTVRLTARAVGRGRTAKAQIDVYVEDVTDARRLEGELRQAQKMEGIGRLASEVAHDFNNLLTTILGYADLVLAQIDPAKPIYRDLREIQSASLRGAVLTQQLVAYSRQQARALEVLDLQEVVATAESSLRRVLGDRVVLRVTHTSGPVRVSADRGQLEQVLMNLTTNARDAMPDGGVLTIDTAAIPVPHPPVHLLSAGRAAGTYVRLAVTDTGTGMDAATQARLFEPFFSTKAWGRGTGLGLSILDSIVTSLGGWITVMSAPAQGSTFEVYLPASEAVVRPSEPAARDALDVGRETILVVDDDPGVLALVSAILTRHGYHVLTADAPDVAITRVAAAPAISLVITDVVMPGLTGPMLMARLRPLGCTRVVYMSGYPTPDFILWAPEEHVRFLAKPFTARDLLACVRRAMEDT